MFKTTFAAGALALATIFASALPTYAVDTPSTISAAPTSALTIAAPSTLDETERSALLFMREEEKLAHDVYTVLYEQWGVRIFSNIAASELTHSNAVATLLDHYNVSDPAVGKAVGEFTDPELQALYDQLVAQGSVSLADALEVGAAIEEIDILDLKERIAETDNADIKLVYNRLLAGSANHLRAFTRTLEQQTGEVYSPQYMTQAEYDAIIADVGNGRHGSAQQGGNRRSR